MALHRLIWRIVYIMQLIKECVTQKIQIQGMYFPSKVNVLEEESPKVKTIIKECVGEKIKEYVFKVTLTLYIFVDFFVK